MPSVKMYLLLSVYDLHHSIIPVEMISYISIRLVSQYRSNSKINNWHYQ